MPRTKLDVHSLVPKLAVMAGLCIMSMSSFGQSTENASRSSPGTAAAHSQPSKATDTENDNASDHNSVATPAITFQGRIAKAGNKLVLAGADDTTYQLDDQQRAHSFLNQQVKVTGVLDATTGTIRIHAIDPVSVP
jgi:uncharacterized protein DUF5818